MWMEHFASSYSAGFLTLGLRHRTVPTLIVYVVALSSLMGLCSRCLLAAAAELRSSNSGIPSTHALLTVARMEPKPLNADPLPKYLEGAFIYDWRKKPRRHVRNGRLEFSVERDGPVYLMASKRRSHFTDVEPWFKELLKGEQLIDRGWDHLGDCPWDVQYRLFVRHCRQGESFLIRTRQFVTPHVIVAQPIDLLSPEYEPLLRAEIVRGLFGSRVKRLLVKKRYGELDELGDRLRRERAKFVSGASKLQAYYRGLQRLPYNASPDQQEILELELEQWVASRPESANGRITLAMALVGNGKRRYGETHDHYLRRKKNASRVMRQAESLNVNDAAFCRLQLIRGLADGESDGNALRFVEQSAAADPWFFETFQTMASNLSPRLSSEGSDSSRLTEFLDRVVQLTHTEAGLANYAVIVGAHRNNQPHSLFQEGRFSWEKTREGYRDFLERYPQAREQREIFCRLACLAWDRETAHGLFEQIGDDILGNVWNSRKNYDYWRWAFHPDRCRGGQRSIMWAHLSNIKDVEYSPEGKRIATIGDDGLLKVWDPMANEEVARFYLGSPDSLAYTTAQYLFVGGAMRGVTAVDIESRATKSIGRHDSPVVALVVAPDGTFVASGGHRGDIKVWHGDTGLLSHNIQSAHGGALLTLAASPDSKQLLSTGQDGIVIVWDPETANMKSRWKAHKASCLTIAFSPDGKLIGTGGSDGRVRVWNARTFQQESSLERPGRRISCVSFSPDSTLLAMACAGGEGPESGAVSLWRFGTDEQPRLLKGHQAAVTSLDFSPDGKSLATVSEDWSLRLWDVER